MIREHNYHHSASIGNTVDFIKIKNDSNTELIFLWDTLYIFFLLLNMTFWDNL